MSLVDDLFGGLQPEEENGEPVELRKFDIPQVHLVDTPANGRRILSRKGMKMPTGVELFSDGKDGLTTVRKDAAPAPAAPDAAAAAPASDAPAADAPPAPPEKLSLSTPAKALVTGVLQTNIDALTKILQTVSDSDPADGMEMTIPSSLQDSVDGVMESLKAGMKHAKVSKRKRMPTGFGKHLRTLLDPLMSALDLIDTSDTSDGVVLSGGNALAPAPAAAAPAPAAAEAPVAKSVMDLQERLTKAFEERLAKKDAEQAAIVKSLQDNLDRVMKSHPPSGQIPAGGAPASAPKAPSTRSYGDLNKYRSDIEASAKPARSGA